MKRIQFHRYGPDEMKLEDYELPAQGAQEILVRVKAASVNPVDWKIRRGVILDISPSASKMMRILFSPSRKFVMGKRDPATLREVAVGQFSADDSHL